MAFFSSAGVFRRSALALCVLGLGAIALPNTASATKLNQGAFVSGTTTYKYGHNSIRQIPVVGAPADTDFSRSAMLHDGSVYRLYYFKRGSRDTIYQFGFNRGTNRYEWGHKSIRVMRIRGIPQSASARSFAMLHDGSVYRLYLQDRNDPRLLHQFGFNRATNDYEYGHNSIPTLRVVGIPRDADYNRWAMLHDGSVYRYYVGKRGSKRKVYQAGYDPSRQQYIWKHLSIPVLTMKGFPRSSNRNNFTMLHDRRDFRFYFLNR